MRFVVVPVAICTSYGKSNSLAIPKFAECKKIWWIMSRVGAERWNIPICRSKNVLTQLHMHVCFHFRVLLQLYIQLHVLPINKGEASIYDLRTHNPPATSPAVMLHQLHHITTMPTCSRNRPKTLPPKNWSFARVGRPQEKISAMYLLLWGIDVGSFLWSNLFGAGVKVTSINLCSSSWTLNFNF